MFYGVSNLAKIAFALPEEMNILVEINHHWSRRSNFGLSIFTHLHFNFIYFSFFFGGGEATRVKPTWKDWEISGIGVHDVNFPKNQNFKIMLKEKKSLYISSSLFYIMHK